MSEETKWQKAYSKLSDDLKVCANAAIMTVLSEQADAVMDKLRQTTPRKTGGLVSSLKKEQLKGNKDRYGYRVSYDGYNSKGYAYATIANALNRGYMMPSFKIIPGKHFIDSAVTLLRGTDQKINEEWEKQVNQRSK